MAPRHPGNEKVKWSLACVEGDRSPPLQLGKGASSLRTREQKFPGSQWTPPTTPPRSPGNPPSGALASQEPSQLVNPHQRPPRGRMLLFQTPVGGRTAHCVRRCCHASSHTGSKKKKSPFNSHLNFWEAYSVLESYVLLHVRPPSSL